MNKKVEFRAHFVPSRGARTPGRPCENKRQTQSERSNAQVEAPIAHHSPKMPQKGRISCASTALPPVRWKFPAHYASVKSKILAIKSKDAQQGSRSGRNKLKHSPPSTHQHTLYPQCESPLHPIHQFRKWRSSAARSTIDNPTDSPSRPLRTIDQKH